MIKCEKNVMIIFDSELAGFCVRFSRLLFYKYVESVIFLDSSMVEHAAVNRGVVGSSPTRGVKNLAPWSSG